MKTRKWMNFKNVLILMVVLSMGLLAGCSGDTGAGDGKTTLQVAKETGSVTIGFANEKPFAYQTADGQLTGEAVEVARAVLTNLGIDEINGELTEFGSLIPGLQAERFDMVTAGMFITPERAQQVAFANPEYSIGQGIGVKAGNPLSLNSYEDIIKHESAKVAVPGGAIEYEQLVNLGMPIDRLVTVPDLPAAVSALQSDRVDAFAATGIAVQSAIDTANDPEIERVTAFVDPIIDGEDVRGYGATAFRKTDTDFRDAFNAELKKLQDSGELLTILEPFGFTKAELPGDVTVEDIVQ